MSEANVKKEVDIEIVSIKQEIESIEEVSITLEEITPPLCIKEVNVKVEPLSTEDEIEDSIQVKTEVFIKEEPCETAEWGVSSAAAEAGLYAGHEVKQELVIGSEGVQPPIAAPSYQAEVTFKRTTEGNDETPLIIEYSPDRKNKVSEEPTPSAKIKKKRNRVQIEGEGTFICDICNRVFTIKLRLIRHIMHYHMKHKSFYCDICDKQFKSHTYAYTHSLLHTGKKTYICKVCNKKFALISSLTKHERIHGGLKPHACEVCKKQFREKSQLVIHTLIHKGETAKQYRCRHCTMKFTQKYKLARHELVHAGERPYVCGICHKGFSQNFQLVVHTRIHTGEKPFVCEVCNKSFVSKNDLVRHERTHTGTKPYRCSVCDRQFTQKAHLNGHKLVHTGEKPYSCNECPKQFTARGTLNRHLRTHAETQLLDKELACRICTQPFKHLRRLQKHEEAHVRAGFTLPSE